MERRVVALAAVLLCGMLLATAAAVAAPLTAEEADFKAAADETFFRWSQWHLNTLGTAVYDVYENCCDQYRVVGGVGTVKGTYAIVSRPKCGGVPCSHEGTFEATFDMQADGSWRISGYTSVPQLG